MSSFAEKEKGLELLDARSCLLVGGGDADREDDLARFWGNAMNWIGRNVFSDKTADNICHGVITNGIGALSGWASKGGSTALIIRNSAMGSGMGNFLAGKICPPLVQAGREFFSGYHHRSHR